MFSDLEVSTVPKDQFEDLNTQYTRLHADWLNLRDEVTQLKLENQQLRE
jgi:KRAB domain-containing zinc finger protein